MSFLKYPAIFCVIVMIAQSNIGCTEDNASMKSSWHSKCGWKAEDYFDDPPVVALCRAIEANDLAEINRLIAAGANVNARGKGKMTPLLWAYPDNKLERFKCLLEHGADPNVLIESDFNTKGGMSKGDSVTHMSCRTDFAGYFEAVFSTNGDPNLTNKSNSHAKDTPLFLLIGSMHFDNWGYFKLLIDKGADLNLKNGSGITPVMDAVGRGKYNLALKLLEAGADYKIYQDNQVHRLIHVIYRRTNSLTKMTPEQVRDSQNIIQWLEDHGESVANARADIQRWDSWSRTTGEFRRKMDAEIAARKAKEATETRDGS